MGYSASAVPLRYAELRDAIDNGTFPAERHWIDFKRELYPTPAAAGDPPRKTKSKAEVHEELARDLASLGPQGGFLIFGVEEDKDHHTFTVVDMPLPAQLDQTIDQVARDRIRPLLTVVPTVISNPANPGHGLLVVEVPESPDPPHMVNGTYYGRTATGKIPLDDEAVERLMRRRGQVDEGIRAAMATTARVDPEPDTDSTHFYFTAVPVQARPDMLLEHTRDHQARMNFISLATNFGNEFARQDGARPEQRAVGALRDARRGQDPRGASFHNYPLHGDAWGVARRLIGLEDNGTVRFIDLAAGTREDGDHPAAAERRERGYQVASAPGNGWPVIYDHQVWWYTLDMIRLVGGLSERHGYRGSWLLGAELRPTLRRSSSLLSGPGCDADQLNSTARASTKELTDDPSEVAADLVRPLFRDLGSEPMIDVFRQQ